MKSKSKKGFRLEILSVLFFFLIITSSYGQYCTNALYSGGCAGDAINNFSLSNLNHTNSGCSNGSSLGYGDFSTSQPTILLSPGSMYSFTISRNPTSGAPVYVSIWIDYSNNNSFSDPSPLNEVVYQSITPSTSSTITNNITIPAGATSYQGNHRLRVRLASSASPMTISNSCTSYSIGETHDYTCNITNYIITTGSISNNICPGATISVPYTISGSGTYNPGNNFSAQISDPGGNGTFNAPVIIGAIPSAASGTINATIPANFPGGSNYRIRVVSSNPGVTGTDNGSNLTIYQRPVVNSLSLSSNSPVCVGNTLTLDATPTTTGTGTGTYSWTGPNGFTSPLKNPQRNNVTSAASGWYVVTYTFAESHGCGSSTKKDSINVDIYSYPAQPTVTGTTSVCAGGTISLTGSTNGNWNGPNGFISFGSSLTITNAQSSNAGYYNLSTGGYCPSGSNLITVAVNNPPNISASSNSPACSDSLLKLKSSGGITYSWTGPNSFVSTEQNPIIPPVAGNYSVSVTDAKGCSNSSFLSVSVITPPTATASSNGPICQGTSLQLNASGGNSYSWTGPNGFSVSEQNPVLNNATANVEGTYTVKVIGSNGCASLSSTTVSLKDKPGMLASNNGPVCYGSDFQLFASNGANSYSWKGPGNFSSNEQNPQLFYPNYNAVNGVDTLVYKVSFSGNNGCSGEDSTEVIIYPSPIAGISLRGGTYISNSNPNIPPDPIPTFMACKGSSVTIDAGNINYNPADPLTAGTSAVINLSNGRGYVSGFHYQINNVTEADSGLYISGVTNGYGCYDRFIYNYNAHMRVVVESASPSVKIVKTSSNQSGSSANFIASTVDGGERPSYQWKKNGLNVGANSESYSDNALNNNDIITVELTSSENCASPAKVTSQAYTVSVINCFTQEVSVSVSPSNSICAGSLATFTATPTNVGINPSYQWRKNGIQVGDASNIYTDNSLSNNDIITLQLFSMCESNTNNQIIDLPPVIDETDYSIVTSTSDPITMTVTPIVTPTVTINSNGFPLDIRDPSKVIICDGYANFTANVTNAGDSPIYQWKKNGVDVGANSSRYGFIKNTLETDVVYLELTSSAACASSSVISNSITTYKVLIPSVSISATSTDICQSTSVTFTASPANNAWNPSYQWQKNGNNVGANSNSNTYTDYSLNDKDVVSVLMTDSEICSYPVLSNSIKMTVRPLPEVSITISPSTTICSGSLVTFKANPENAGSSPTYHWKKNGSNLTETTDIYIDNTLNSNDIISVSMTDMDACAVNATVSSNTIKMSVIPTVIPTVQVSASPSTSVCSGAAVTFSATSTNSGTSGIYQWKKNGEDIIGTNGNTLVDNTLLDQDVITVQLTSNAACASPISVVSNPITIILRGDCNQKQSQTITFPPIPKKWIGEQSVKLNATASSGLPVSYSVSNSTLASIVNDILYFKKAGTVTVTASQLGNVNYLPAVDVKINVVITSKKQQTIAFSALPTLAVNSVPIALNFATASSGLPVTYKSSNPAIATITGNILTVVGGGTVNITASQAGDASYDAAPSISRPLVVSKLDQAITFNTLPGKLTTDAPFELNASSSSGLPVIFTSSNTAVATVSGNVVTIIGAGTTNITASQAGNSMYKPTSIGRSLVVSKYSQIITFNTLPAKLVTDAPFALNAVASSGLPIIYTSSNSSIAKVTGNIVTIVGVGTVNITATQAGNLTYKPVSITRSLVINKAPQTVTFNALAAKLVNDAPFALNATSSSGLPITYTSSNLAIAKVTGNIVTIMGAGTVNITASQAGDLTYKPASITRPLVVNKLSQTITFNALPKKYTTDVPFGLRAISSAELPIMYVSSNPSVARISEDVVIIVGVGTANITASQAGNSEYKAASATRSLTVIQAPAMRLAAESIDMESESLPKLISVFPNPVANGEEVAIDLLSEEMASVSIYDLNGNLVQTENDLISNQPSLKVNLLSGVYWMDIVTDRRKQRIKLVVM